MAKNKIYPFAVASIRSMENKLLILICVAVAIIVVAWLVRFILGILKTKRVYKEILEKKAQEQEEQKGLENDQN